MKRILDRFRDRLGGHNCRRRRGGAYSTGSVQTLSFASHETGTSRSHRAASLIFPCTVTPCVVRFRDAELPFHRRSLTVSGSVALLQIRFIVALQSRPQRVACRPGACGPEALRPLVDSLHEFCIHCQLYDSHSDTSTLKNADASPCHDTRHGYQATSFDRTTKSG